MKILFVSSGNSVNGISPIILRQGESLQNAGNSVTYYTIKGKGIRGYFKNIFLLRSFLRTVSYDVIHAHYGLTAMVTLLANGNKRMIVSFMGDDICGSKTKKGKVTSASAVLTRLSIFLANWVYLHSIVKSEEMLNKIRFGKASLLPNGVDLKIFKPADKKISRLKMNIPEEEIIILFASDPGRPEKNFPLAEQAFNRLKKDGYSMIPLKGYSQNELANLYNGANLLILSSFHEGSPNVVKEAMACNCPIVATDVGDVKWVIGNTKGCHLSSFNVTNFSTKMSESINFEQEYGNTLGRERIIELGLDSESTAKKIVELYNNKIS